MSLQERVLGCFELADMAGVTMQRDTAPETKLEATFEKKFVAFLHKREKISIAVSI